MIQKKIAIREYGIYGVRRKKMTKYKSEYDFLRIFATKK